MYTLTTAPQVDFQFQTIADCLEFLSEHFEKGDRTVQDRGDIILVNINSKTFVIRKNHGKKTV